VLDRSRPTPSGGSAQQTRPTATTGPSTTFIETTTSTLAFGPRTGPTTPEDEALAARFLELAAAPDHEGVEALPLPDRVTLGLGPVLFSDRSSEELEGVAGWTLDLELFRGHTGPFSLLELAAASTTDTVTLVGDHPRCASPAQAPPVEVAELRRVVIEPDPAAIASCIEWWRIELYVTPNGEVAAVTLDLWEP
jgi:hypothetical protein